MQCAHATCTNTTMQQHTTHAHMHTAHNTCTHAHAHAHAHAQPIRLQTFQAMIPDFCPHGSANGGRLLYADLAVPREDALGGRAEPGPDPPEPGGGASASPCCFCASAKAHSTVGSTGFKMPDPYGLGEYKEGLLPHDATPEDILEALHLWAVPEEAHPPVGCSSQVNYQLKYLRGSRCFC